MNNLVTINNKQIKVKEYKGLRIATMWDVAKVHSVLPEVIRDNFENNAWHMTEGKHYFRLSKYSEFAQDLIRSGEMSQNQLNAVKDIPIFTEKGYLMIVKPLQGELAWRVQDQMIDNYYTAISSISNLSPQLQLLINMELKQKQIEKKQQVLEHRINTLDATNIDGTPRQRLNSIIRKYAFDKGIPHTSAWKHFRSNFNRAYGMNIEQRLNNYLLKNKIKSLTYPEYLERVGLIEDALRVADKMLNKEAM